MLFYDCNNKRIQQQQLKYENYDDDNEDDEDEKEEKSMEPLAIAVYFVIAGWPILWPKIKGILTM